MCHTDLLWSLDIVCNLLGTPMSLCLSVYIIPLKVLGTNNASIVTLAQWADHNLYVVYQGMSTYYPATLTLNAESIQTNLKYHGGGRNRLLWWAGNDQCSARHV
jgi:hypothetical protein